MPPARIDACGGGQVAPPSGQVPSTRRLRERTHLPQRRASAECLSRSAVINWAYPIRLQSGACRRRPAPSGPLGRLREERGWSMRKATSCGPVGRPRPSVIAAESHLGVVITRAASSTAPGGNVVLARVPASIRLALTCSYATLSSRPWTAEDAGLLPDTEAARRDAVRTTTRVPAADASSLRPRFRMHH